MGKRSVKRLAAAMSGYAARELPVLAGALDLTGRRYTLAARGYHQLVTPDARYDGMPGREWRRVGPDALDADGADDTSPLWLLDVLAGTLEAHETEAEVVRGVPCRRLDVRTDVSVASRETPGGVAAPAVVRYEDLLALPLTVGLGDGHVRRVFRDKGMARRTLELFAHGAPIDPAVWEAPPALP